MVTPRTADEQIRGGQADAPEPVLLEHPLGGGVVGEGAGLQPVQPGLAEGSFAGEGDRPCGQAAAASLTSHRVAHVGTLERAAHDVRDREPARHVTGLQDQEAQARAHGGGGHGLLELAALPLDGEELIRSGRLEWGEEVALRRHEGREPLGVRDAHRRQPHLL